MSDFLIVCMVFALASFGCPKLFGNMCCRTSQLAWKNFCKRSLPLGVSGGWMSPAWCYLLTARTSRQMWLPCPSVYQIPSSPAMRKQARCYLGRQVRSGQGCKSAHGVVLVLCCLEAAEWSLHILWHVACSEEPGRCLTSP